jgi:hypothetical protein
MPIENFTPSANVPQNFSDFLNFFKNWISGQKQAMKNFL